VSIDEELVHETICNPQKSRTQKKLKEVAGSESKQYIFMHLNLLGAGHSASQGLPPLPRLWFAASSIKSDLWFLLQKKVAWHGRSACLKENLMAVDEIQRRKKKQLQSLDYTRHMDGVNSEGLLTTDSKLGVSKQNNQSSRVVSPTYGFAWCLNLQRSFVILVPKF